MNDLAIPAAGHYSKRGEKRMESNKSLSSKNRHSGLDLLRILAMIMIVCGHFLGFVNDNHLVSDSSVLYHFTYFISALCMPAVNCFVLISAFFLSERQFKLSRIIKLDLTVLFYSAVLWFIGVKFGSTAILSEETINSFFPISFGNYWYISAYVGMVFLSPLLNLFISKINRRQHLITTCFLVLLFAVWCDILPRSNPFSVGSGYCLSWFVVLYLIASYLKKYGSSEKMNKRHHGMIYFGMVLLLFLSFFVLNIMLKGEFFQVHKFSEYLYRYNSIIVLVESIALFLFFKNVSLSSKPVERISSIIVPVVLDVYLIHTNRNVNIQIWQFLINQFQICAEWAFPLKMVAITLIVFISCIIIALIRKMCFDCFEKRKWFLNLMKKIDQFTLQAASSIARFMEKHVL